MNVDESESVSDLLYSFFWGKGVVCRIWQTWKEKIAQVSDECEMASFAGLDS